MASSEWVAVLSNLRLGPDDCKEACIALALLGGVRMSSRVTLLLQAELDRFVNALISIREEVRDIENGKLDR